MEHVAAIESGAAERYLLGEMAEAERNEFEAHFFECSLCAADVCELSQFRANLLSVLAEAATDAQSEPGAWERWFGWLRPAIAVPALASLLLVVGYQNLIERRAAPALEAEAGHYLLLHGEARGDEATAQAAGGRLVVLLDLAAVRAGATVLVRTTRSAGGVASELTMSAPAPGEPLTLVFPRGALQPDLYTICVLNPDNRVELARYPFRIR